MRAARKLIMFLLFMALIIFLASCTQFSGAATAPQAGLVENPDLTGSSQSGGEEHGIKLRLGLLLVHDKHNPAAAEARRGIELALLQNEYRIGGIEIELVEVDEDLDLLNPLTVASATEQMISSGEVHALIGGLIPDTATPAVAVADSAGVPLLVLEENVPSMEQQAVASARLARDELGGHRAFITYDVASSGAHQAAGAFREFFAAEGGETIAIWGLENDPPAGRIEEMLAAMASDPPDVWYLATGAEMAERLIRLARSVDIDPVILGTWSWGEPGSLPGAGTGNGVVVPSLFHPDRPDPNTAAFLEEYRRVYGEEPSYIAALAYDAIGRILWAVEGALASDRLDLSDTAAARATIHALLSQAGEYNGVTGNWFIGEAEEISKSVLFVRLMPGPNNGTEFIDEIFP